MKTATIEEMKMVLEKAEWMKKEDLEVGYVIALDTIDRFVQYENPWGTRLFHFYLHSDPTFWGFGVFGAEIVATDEDDAKWMMTYLPRPPPGTLYVLQKVLFRRENKAIGREEWVIVSAWECVGVSWGKKEESK